MAMTATAQEVVQQYLADDCLHYRARTDAQGHCGACQLPDLVQLLVAFAQARERAVWEEAARVSTTGRFHFPSLAAEFRRRATDTRKDSK